ncbi:MAG: signal peptidase II [Bacteriovoracia bacterium]
MRKWKVLVGLTLGVLVLDQITKWLVMVNFRLHETRPIIEGYFNLTYIRNTGAAFGIFANADPAFRVPFFLIIPLAALAVIALVFRRLPPENVGVASALSLVIGGAVGNLIDRVRFGSVVDFLDFHWQYVKHFPAFNVADMAICVGVGILMVDLLFNKEHTESKEAHVSNFI